MISEINGRFPSEILNRFQISISFWYVINAKQLTATVNWFLLLLFLNFTSFCFFIYIYTHSIPEETLAVTDYSITGDLGALTTCVQPCGFTLFRYGRFGRKHFFFRKKIICNQHCVVCFFFVLCRWLISPLLQSPPHPAPT